MGLNVIMILGFDLTDKQSFDQLNYWIYEIEKNKSKEHPLYFVLFGNKCDDKEYIVIKDDDIETLKKKYNLEYFSTSAKDGTIFN